MGCAGIFRIIVNFIGYFTKQCCHLCLQFSLSHVLFLTLTGHGNHKEDSPFLNSADSPDKKNDFYDRNLALFEVCNFQFAIFN